MADLAASDVAVAVSPRDRDIVPPPAGRKVMTIASIAFGDGVKTYPSGGVPLPDMGQFGFKREIGFVAIQQPASNGFMYKYDQENHKLKIFTLGVTTGDTAAASCTNGALALDSDGSETAVRLSGTAISTTYDLGAMIELPDGSAPAAVSMSLLMVGE
ncbi:hypothetical protein [Desulfatibacillum aliphaticivorans]|uniref:hypothetical protein n=1 Tax=Desulfatibacillum aliphaticivorans TaxID=218208 RepID=UPI0003FEA700|nr:hypothetical protein [Desulfatibacillum aliphaticivorans]